LHFTPGDGTTAEPDVRVLSDQDLERAGEDGKQRGEGAAR
jgi:hypothetical protein